MLHPCIVAQHLDFTVSHGIYIYSVNVVCQEASGTARVWCCH